YASAAVPGRRVRDRLRPDRRRAEGVHGPEDVAQRRAARLRHQRLSLHWSASTSARNTRFVGRSAVTIQSFMSIDGALDGVQSIQPERAVLLAADTRDGPWPVDESLAELSELARTAGAVVVGSMSQRLEHPDPRTYLGRG